MSRRVDFTDDEVVFLRDIVAWWAEGCPEAKQMTMEDGALEDFEQLLRATDGLDDQVRKCQNILEKLTQ